MNVYFPEMIWFIRACIYPFPTDEGCYRMTGLGGGASRVAKKHMTRGGAAR